MLLQSETVIAENAEKVCGPTALLCLLGNRQSKAMNLLYAHPLPPAVTAVACQVKLILSSVDKPGELDAIIEEVPQLLDPRQLALSLSNLARWFPSQHPVEVRLGRCFVMIE